jgi:predicted RNA binding protein YcfA (HicA-like mRNA interferase family)
MNSWTIIRMLEKGGWCKVDQSGSHIQFRHPSKKGRVTVPHPKKDIPIVAHLKALNANQESSSNRRPKWLIILL